MFSGYAVTGIFRSFAPRMEDHLYIPKEPWLSDAVTCFWQVKKHNDLLRRETIVPKGMVEIIFSFYEDQPIDSVLCNGGFRVPRCFIQGYHQRPIELNLPEKQSLFGIVLHPAVIKPVFGVTAGELAASCIDMSLLNASFNLLWYQLSEQDYFHNRVVIVSEWLKKRLPVLSAREQAFNTLLFRKTIRPVSELPALFCYSTRQLARKFQELTGMNAEQTMLYLKHLRSVDLIHHSGASLTSIAYDCGFADQSHFIKTFRSFTSFTPSEYRSRKSALPGHIFSNVR